MTKYIAFLGLFNEQFYKKLAKDGNQFLAATAAQEAHLFICPYVHPSVTKLQLCNFATLPHCHIAKLQHRNFATLQL